jgi:hypothetical protein
MTWVRSILMMLNDAVEKPNDKFCGWGSGYSLAKNQRLS